MDLVGCVMHCFVMVCLGLSFLKLNSYFTAKDELFSLKCRITYKFLKRTCTRKDKREDDMLKGTTINATAYLIL